MACFDPRFDGAVIPQYTRENARVLSGWLSTKNVRVARVVAMFPPGTWFFKGDDKYFVIRYTDDGRVGLTNIDPCSDFDAAADHNNEIALLCPACVRGLALQSANRSGQITYPDGPPVPPMGSDN